VVGPSSANQYEKVGQQQQFYQSNVSGSPFIKKRSNEGDNTGIANLLDELGESRISYIQSLQEPV
jgi:hypothetical protein